MQVRHFIRAFNKKATIEGIDNDEFAQRLEQFKQESLKNYKEKIRDFVRWIDCHIIYDEDGKQTKEFIEQKKRLGL